MPERDDTGLLSSAVDAVFERVEHTRAQVEGYFPVYCTGPQQAWFVSRRGSWVGGFWIALLTLLARRTKQQAAVRSAIAAAERSRHWLREPLSERSMVFWYGLSGAGDLIPQAQAYLTEAAQLVAGSYDPALQACASEGRGDEDGPLFSVDALAATTALLGWGARLDERYMRYAWHNFESHRKRCFLGDSVRTPVRASGEPASTTRDAWSRGHAWALLASVEAVRVCGHDCAAVAKTLANTWLAKTTRTQGIPTWNLSGSGPVDTSAAAIAALALLKLVNLGVGSAGEYLQHAHRTLVCLAADYVVKQGEDRGRLWGGCYDWDKQLVPDGELIWGTYFFLVASRTWLSMRSVFI